MGGIGEKIRAWLTKAGMACRQFMTGRNGVDSLGLAILWGVVILSFLRTIFALMRLRFPMGICTLGMDILIIWMLFRLFSRNIYRRQEENQKWLTLSARMRSRFAPVRGAVSGRVGKICGFFTRAADREHKYFTCRDCGTVCRVPRGKGKIVITCPHCGARIQGKS